MKKLLLLWVFVTTSMGIFSFVEAQTIVYQQPVKTTQIVGDGFFSYGGNFQVSTDGYLDSIKVNMSRGTLGNVSASVACYTTTAYNVRCPGWSADYVSPVVSVDTTAADYTFTFATSTSISHLLMENSYYYRFAVHGGTNISGYGTSTPNTCFFQCTGSPYLYVYQIDKTSNSQDTSSRIVQLITPANGSTSGTANVTFQFSWFNSGLELYSVSQIEISDLTSGYQYTPVQSNAAVSGYGTTTQILSLTPNHLHLWRACLLNPTSGQKTCSPTRSLNVVGASASSSFPTLPTVDDSNATSTIEGSIWGFLNAYSMLQQKLPFAYFFQIGDLLYELQSTSTSSFEPVVFDYGSLDISTTSKNALPDQWIAFSTSTVVEYIPSGVLDVWRLLMQAVIWFSFIAYIYHSIGRLFTGSTNVV